MGSRPDDRSTSFVVIRQIACWNNHHEMQFVPTGLSVLFASGPRDLVITFWVIVRITGLA